MCDILYTCENCNCLVNKEQFDASLLMCSKCSDEVWSDFNSLNNPNTTIDYEESIGD